MAFDYSKLLGLMREKSITQSEAAKHLGISENALSHKVTNKYPFKQTEIMSLCDLLEIQPSRLSEYFFTPKVEKTATNSDGI